ncbi:hypothetical protein [Streptomyces sp. NRRL S-337]|uniref:hypothetical protein n=1 Tax=Streptomyces sp. NRRL S-337 TaxID=1463900 RepID=UPI000691D6B2|nr:hypothetical protein [Streptomyces sp. NRRL S-337]
MTTDGTSYLPAPDVLWSHAATLASWSAEQQLPVHNYRHDEAELRSEDVGNGWWALSWVEDGRAVLYGVDHDYSETVSLSPPLDLLADGPSWLPWQRLDEVIAGGEEIGFVYWWDGRAWGRTPYPAEVHDDGVRSMVPADDSEVRQVCADLVADGADPAAVREREAAHRRTAALPNESAALPAGHGEPAGRRVPCWLPEQHAAVLAVEMKAATELNRPEPPATSEQERLIAWLRTNGTRTGGSSVLSAAFVDAGDTDYGRGADGFLDELGRRIFGEAATLLTAPRDAEADPERGRWLYIRITVPDTNFNSNSNTDADADANSTIERGYDCLPDWWPDRRGVVAALPHTVRLEMARRAAHWRPNWTELLEEDVRLDGAPARLCRVELGLPHISPLSTPHADADASAGADTTAGAGADARAGADTDAGAGTESAS